MTRNRQTVLFGALWLTAALLPAQTPEPPKLGQLEFTLLDSKTGQPVKNAVLKVWAFSPRYFEVKAATDNRGHVLFASLPPGDYRPVSVEARGYSFESFVQKSPVPPIIQLSEGATIQPPPLLLDPAGVIDGRVQNQDGDPIPGATVSAVRILVHYSVKELIPLKFAQTNDRGEYRLFDLPPGQYYLRVNVSPLRPFIGDAVTPEGMAFPAVYYPSAADPSSAIRVQVAPGSEVSKIDFKIRPVQGFRIRGAVAGRLRMDVHPMVQIRPCPPDRLEWASSIVQSLHADGTFESNRLPPGDYCLTYEEQGALSGQTPANFAIAQVRLTDKDLNDVVLNAAPPVTISGTAPLEKDGHYPGFVELLPLLPVEHLGPPARVNTKTGKFQLEGVLPIDYKIMVSGARPYADLLTSIRLGGADVTDGYMKAIQAPTEMSIEMVLATASLQGKVDFGSVKPVEGLHITIVPDGALGRRSDRIAAVYTDANGAFRLEKILPGVYRIFAWEKFDFNLAQLPEYLARFRGATIRVEEGGQPNVDVKLIPAREIEEVMALF